MAQHFLLSRNAKTLTLAQVFRMSDADAEAMFRKVRWAETDGAPVCPECGSLDAYECRRASGALRFRCKGCKADFSITSGTLFSSHKLPLRQYLAAIAIFCNEVKGKSMLALSRDLGLAYKSAFVLCHKMREAMAQEFRLTASMALARIGRKAISRVCAAPRLVSTTISRAAICCATLRKPLGAKTTAASQTAIRFTPSPPMP